MPVLTTRARQPVREVETCRALHDTTPCTSPALPGRRLCLRCWGEVVAYAVAVDWTGRRAKERGR